MKKLVVTGGGTGGHVFPALSLAQEFQNRGFKVVYLGSEKGLEARLTQEKNLPFIPVESGAVKNQGIFQILLSLVAVIKGLVRSVQILRQEKPSCIIGVGGYVSVPVCLAGFLLRIPVYLQEQNVSVGIANRVLGRISRKVFLGFSQATQYFNPEKCVVTGNPIRPELIRDSRATYNAQARSILIMGGSQGARAINDVLIRLLPKLSRDLRIVHQTGVTDAERVAAAYKEKGFSNVQVTPFIEDVGSAYAEAALVICRSGALTVSELIAVGRPAVFVPYPRQGQNDQTANAYFLEKEGAARVVEQGPDFEMRFWDVFQQVFRPTQLAAMAKNLYRLRTPPALASIAGLISSDLGLEDEASNVRKN